MSRPSLFVVSLPRSLSTLLYHAIRQSLALREPQWTTDGEILNVRRFAFLAEEGAVEGVRYVQRDHDGPRFAKLLAFLDQVTQAQGFAYKDVIQPFVVGEWLARQSAPPVGVNRPAAAASSSAAAEGATAAAAAAERRRSASSPNSPARPTPAAPAPAAVSASSAAAPAPRVLVIDRPVPDVAASLLDRGWLYPALAADGAAALPEAARAVVAGAHTADLSAFLPPDQVERALVSGLLRARRTLARLADPPPACASRWVVYDQLIHDEAPLHQALQALYGEDVPPPAYLDDEFCRQRDQVLRRRASPLYQRLQALSDELATTMLAAPPAAAIGAGVAAAPRRRTQ